MDGLDILVTNDDGVDAVGFQALYEELSTIGNVTAVAPDDDQSAVGRTVSESVSAHGHELGYVVEGTPADCVIAGLSSLLPETDLVVAGCNHGANLGAGVLGRSGTVSAAVEAAFLGVPALSTSMYVPNPHWEKTDGLSIEQFDTAVRATAYLAERALQDDVFQTIDYLNVNSPLADRATGEMRLTYPSEVYELYSEQDESEIRIQNSIWEKLDRGSIPDPEGTDRRAILENCISVSPLTVTQAIEENSALDGLVAEFSNLSHQ
ncbi:MAG: 5'/3'-nucleotidase SurE [Halovenus sp.]